MIELFFFWIVDFYHLDEVALPVTDNVIPKGKFQSVSLNLL